MDAFHKRIAQKYLEFKLDKNLPKFEEEHKREDELIFRISEASLAANQAYEGYVGRIKSRLDSLQNTIEELNNAASTPGTSISQKASLLNKYEALLRRISRMQ